MGAISADLDVLGRSVTLTSGSPFKTVKLEVFFCRENNQDLARCQDIVLEIYYVGLWPSRRLSHRIKKFGH